MPEICTCPVGVLVCTTGWDADQQVMGGVLERLVTLTDGRRQHVTDQPENGDKSCPPKKKKKKDWFMNALESSKRS